MSSSPRSPTPALEFTAAERTPRTSSPGSNICIVRLHWYQRADSAGRRMPIVPLLIAALLGAVLLYAYLYDRGRSDLIAPGVRIAGVDVGGLRAPAARVRLRSQLRLNRATWITLRHGALRFTLTGAQARLRADVDGAVREAVRASHGGWFLSSAVRELFGGRVNQSIPLAVSYSHGAVARLLSRTRAAIDRPARDASVTMDPSAGAKLVTIPSHRGTIVDASVLRRELSDALGEPTAAHVLSIRTHALKPTLTTKMLAARYPAYIVVDRPDFKLLLYERLRLTHAYSIAVGMAGLETPAGLHHIVDKQINPSWHVPHSAWAGSLAGHVIPPGPQDPLVARWMGIDDQGDGIHGTNEPGSIGSAASHGCIRMLVPDVIQLYSLTPLGAPVYVI